MSKRKPRTNKIGRPFAARPIAMLQSPAMRVLSLTGERILRRLEIEIARHGGNDNGKLTVSYEQFMKYGIARHAVPVGLREVIALGFVAFTVKGRGGNAEFRRASQYRLTYLATARGAATDEWQKFTSVEQAEAAWAAARTVPEPKHFPAPSNAKNQPHRMGPKPAPSDGAQPLKAQPHPMGLPSRNSPSRRC